MIEKEDLSVTISFRRFQANWTTVSIERPFFARKQIRRDITTMSSGEYNDCEKYSSINIINNKTDKLPVETFTTITMQMTKPKESIWVVIISHNPPIVTTLPSIKSIILCLY